MSAPKFCPQCATPLVERMADDRARLCCPACRFIHYGNPTPVVAGLVEHEGDVLLVRNVGWPDSWFGLVSGFLEANESPEEGMLRELKEELNLAGQIESLIGVYPFAMRNEVIVAYHLTAHGTPTASAELAAFKRVPPHKLRPWPQGTGMAVRDWLARRGLNNSTEQP